MNEENPKKTKSKINPKKKSKTKKKASSPLSPKHMEFFLAYISLGRNATKAYLRAYPKVTYETASVNGSKLLRNTKFAAYLQDYDDKKWKEKEKEIGKTFNNLLKVANADISDIVEYEDNKMSIRNFSDIDTSAIQEVNHTVSETAQGINVKKSIKMHDKMKAIDGIMKALGMTNKIEFEGDIIIKPAVRPEEKPEEGE